VANNEYAFFVRDTTPADPITGKLNSYENYLDGKANRAFCKIVSVDAKLLKSFLATCGEIHSYVECVYSPNDNVKEINATFEASKQAAKSETEILKEENQKLRDKLESYTIAQAKELEEIKKQLRQLNSNKKTYK